jgi:enoyl-CoA hydratase/carnithine racemase
MPATASSLIRKDHDGVTTLTLDRPDQFNALSEALIAELSAALESIAADPGVRVLVLAGAGRAFCAGHDLRELRARPDPVWHRELFARCAAMMQALPALPQPVIARVHGIATAAGCQLVSMCDLAVASESASFALPGVNIGVFCSTPAVGVARNIGRKRVMELLLTGQPVQARTALEWGLVNRVVPVEELDAEVARFAGLIASRSTAAIALGKRTFYAQVAAGLDAAYETAGDAMTCNLSFADAAEGIDAFLGKRVAVWQGR